MGVAEPLRRPTASRGRKRPRAAARLVGTSRAACCRPRLRVNPFLVWFVFLWLLFSGVRETLIFGTGDWFAFGEPFFCGLFTPTYPLPGHRLVPESHFERSLQEMYSLRWFLLLRPVPPLDVRGAKHPQWRSGRAPAQTQRASGSLRHCVFVPPPARVAVLKYQTTRSNTTTRNG